MRFIVGVDAGSAAIKALAFGEGRPVAWLQEPTGPDIRAQCTRLLERLLASPALGGAQPRLVCATGYGRNLVAEADGQVSEILANAVGAGWMWRHWDRLDEVWGAAPEPPAVPGRFRTIVDIGGQDSKVITFTAEGLVDQFAMNDRCAAGTGRFLEVMARALGEDLARADALALGASGSVRMSSTCTVFAESEVISLVSEGVAREEVAAGIFRAVADRTAELARQIGWRAPVMFDGGPSHCKALRRALERSLGCQVAVPPCAEFTTALGATVFAGGSDDGARRGQGH